MSHSKSFEKSSSESMSSHSQTHDQVPLFLATLLLTSSTFHVFNRGRRILGSCYVNFQGSNHISK